MIANTSSSMYRTISIVDDDEDICTLFSDALTFDGSTIFTFTDPCMALEHFKLYKESYALVISDLRMPGLTGIELIKELKKLNPIVRTVLMTAIAIDEGIIEEYSKKELINRFLEKPIRIEDPSRSEKSVTYL